MLQRVFSAVTLAAAVFGTSATVTEFPPLSLYCGNGGFSASDTDNLGSFAVNGDFQVKNYAAGAGLAPAPFGTRDIGVIQGAGNVANFQVSGGNLVYCGKLTQSELAVNGGNLIQSCDRFDFAGTNAFVSDFSSTFQKLPPTGAPTRVDDEFTFDAAAGVEVNVYDVQAALFDSIQQLNINAPAGVFVVINIDGTTNTFQNFQTTLAGGIDQQHIIYNFYQTTSLTVQDIAVEGTIVAPAAAVQFNNGHIDGSFFVASVTGNGEIHPFPPITPPCPITPCPPCPTVGPLPPFTAFAIGDLTSKGSDDLGTMAAGGNINLVDYSINLQDPFNGTCEIALVAGGSISYLNGQVRGSVYAGASSNLTDVTQPTGCVNGHNVGKDTIVNFDAAAKNLQSVSSAYGARPATNPTLRMYDQVTLQTAATETGVSVFSFPSSLLAGCTGLTIIAPAGQLVLINIPGTTNSISDFQITLQGGVDAAHVLWNYYESTSLSIENVYVIGTTIAPSAAVTFTAGQLHGALYAGSISGIGEYHPQPPVIPICPICPVNPCN